MTPTAAQLEHSTTALLLALSARSLETGNHCPRVNQLSLALGRALTLTGDELHALHLGSLLHDVGKLQTPDAVLKKPGSLTETEWTTMHEHPVTGSNMLRSLGYPEAACLIVEQHHERYDGEGYPLQLRESEISLGARIFAIADTYDAITNTRVYRNGASPAAALHEITSWSGRQFDPAIVQVFLAKVRPA